MIGSPEVDVDGITGAGERRAAAARRRLADLSWRQRCQAPRARLSGGAGAHAVDRGDDLGRVEVVVVGREPPWRSRSDV